LEKPELANCRQLLVCLFAPIAAALIGGISGPAFAKDEGFAARGLGAETCSKFIKESLLPR